MFSVFAFALDAILPILLLILLGFALRQTGWFTEDFVSRANRFNFQFCLCSTIFCNVYGMNSLSDIPLALGGVCLAALVVITLAGVVVAHLTTKDPLRRGPLVQNSFRSNCAVIGLSLSEALAGPAGLAVASALQAVQMLYFNIAASLVFALYNSGSAKINPRAVLRALLRNPIIQGLLSGLVCVMVRGLLPVGADGSPVFTIKNNLPFLYTTINNLGKIGTPFALILLGGQFSFKAIRGFKKELIVGVLNRLVLSPAIGFAVVLAAGWAGLISPTQGVIAAMISLFASPTAVSSAALAGQMGSDEQLAGQLIVWTSLCSAFSLFIIITLFRTIGLL